MPLLNYVTQLVRTSMAAAPATVYTVPATKTVVLTSIVVVNTNAASRTYTILLDGVEYAKDVNIPGKTTHQYDNVRQVLTATKIIQASASAATDVKLHISGVTS
ncbi:MAG: hypothetical protein F2667_13030 [Actinobacteria bacterium]|uniref:Unannotated protein n=1 Tax=freshwater metagenome TaxID=449393 RepID=A0A6J6S3Y2_9ZZZZ|nr:hypothetical protein [Actinomycetota bacterium]